MRLVVVALILPICFFISSCSHLDEKHQYAEMIIEKVEKFKSINNQLPKDVTQIGLIEEMNSLAFYEMKNDSIYIVWYGMGLGESNIYSSSTKRWKVEG